jgi:hypothetical protein
VVYEVALGGHAVNEEEPMAVMERVLRFLRTAQ